MSPIGIEESINDQQVRDLLQRLGDHVRGAKPAFKSIGEEVLTSIKLNFERGGREGGRTRTWQPLAPATVKERCRLGLWPGQILVRKGVSGGLLGSINYQAFDDRVVIGARKRYAAIQQLGGWFQTIKGRRTVKVPARPYLVVQPEDREIMRRTIIDHLMAAVRRGT